MSGRRSRFLFDPLRDLGEVAGVAEVLIDARKADVGDVVERFQAGHHRLADSRRRDLVAECFHLPLHAADEAVDSGRVDVAFASRMADRASELVAVERLALGVLFDDGQVAQLHSLEGSKARATGLALAAAADRRAILARPA